MSTFILPKLLGREAKVAGIAKFLLSLSAGKAWRIEVTEERSTRSVQQCRYLNGVAYKLLSEATGYERDDISEYMCALYFGEREKRVPKSKNFPNGIELVPCRTTTTNEAGKRDVLTWDQFADYVAFVQRFAASKGIYIPDPDPDYNRLNEQAEAA